MYLLIKLIKLMCMSILNKILAITQMKYNVFEIDLDGKICIKIRQINLKIKINPFSSNQTVWKYFFIHIRSFPLEIWTIFKNFFLKGNLNLVPLPELFNLPKKHNSSPPRDSWVKIARAVYHSHIYVMKYYSIFEIRI